MLTLRGEARFRFGYTVISSLIQERLTGFGDIKRLELGVL
jgi:hypothetical protein